MILRFLSWLDKVLRLRCDVCGAKVSSTHSWYELNLCDYCYEYELWVEKYKQDGYPS